MTTAGLRQVSVFCTDDNAGFRRVLKDLVDATPGFLQVGEACTGEEALMLVPRLRPDFVLMDVHMPGMGGVRAAETLVETRRDLVVALISADLVELPVGFSCRGRRVASLVKDELCPRLLLDLWHGC